MSWFVVFSSDDSTVKYREKEFYCMWEFQQRDYKSLRKCFGGVLKLQCSLAF